MSTQHSIPPIVGELEAIFATLPDGKLLDQLRGPTRRGPKGYPPVLLWRCFIAYYLMGLDSVADLVRLLRDNPYVSSACGIEYVQSIPSQATFSRFGSKLARKWNSLAVKKVFRALTLIMYERLPGFAETVAIDSSDLKAWSNGGKLRKGKHSDEDAGWCVKKDTSNKKKYVWGYKIHALVCAKYELPIAVDTTPGNLNDSRKATPLLQQARYTNGHFQPQYVLADKGYSSRKIRMAIRWQYGSYPIIAVNASHKKEMERVQMDDEWLRIYQRRQAVERFFGRMKAHRRLNDIRWRGKMKVRVHVLLAVIVQCARALAFPDQVRGCVRPA